MLVKQWNYWIGTTIPICSHFFTKITIAINLKLGCFFESRSYAFKPILVFPWEMYQYYVYWIQNWAQFKINYYFNWIILGRIKGYIYKHYKILKIDRTQNLKTVYITVYMQYIYISKLSIRTAWYWNCFGTYWYNYRKFEYLFYLFHLKILIYINNMSLTLKSWSKQKTKIEEKNFKF